MTVIQIELPEATAKAAREAGLLTPAALEQLLTAALRRQAGRRLIEVARQIQAAGIEEMSMDEIDDEVHALRAARRTATSS
jgi:predicted exporter